MMFAAAELKQNKMLSIINMTNSPLEVLLNYRKPILACELSSGVYVSIIYYMEEM